MVGLTNGTSGAAGEPLFSPLQLGDITLQHRVVLAPLTRYRADIQHVPQGECGAVRMLELASI